MPINPGDPIPESCEQLGNFVFGLVREENDTVLPAHGSSFGSPGTLPLASRKMTYLQEFLDLGIDVCDEAEFAILNAPLRVRIQDPTPPPTPLVFSLYRRTFKYIKIGGLSQKLREVEDESFGTFTFTGPGTLNLSFTIGPVPPEHPFVNPGSGSGTITLMAALNAAGDAVVFTGVPGVDPVQTTMYGTNDSGGVLGDPVVPGNANLNHFILSPSPPFPIVVSRTDTGISFVESGPPPPLDPL